MYDLSLEQFAQNYLDGLDSCPLQHNPENTDYGENVYFQTSYGNTDDTVDYKYIVSLWHEEREYYNYYDNNCNAPPRESCGHYTQVSLLAHPVRYSLLRFCVCRLCGITLRKWAVD